MAALPSSDVRDPCLLAIHSVDGEETMSEAIVDAFCAANVDVFGEDTTLQDWIETDAIEGFEWSSDRPLTVATRIWDHEVVITAEAVRIYPGSAVT